jgi:hypothetical protein
MIKQVLFDLLEQGKAKEVFAQLKKIVDSQSSYFKDPLVLLQSRFNRNENEKNQGLQSASDYKIERNRIESALKSLIDDEFNESMTPDNFIIDGILLLSPAVAPLHTQVQKSQKTKPVKIFISYSKSDIDYLNSFKKHLKPLERNGSITMWDDSKLGAGDVWKVAIEYQLSTADIIIFLVSSDMIATDFVWDVEMKIAFSRHISNDVIIVPVILRDCGWQQTNFVNLNALPNKGTPISTFKPQDEGWALVYNKVNELIDKLTT